MQNSERVKEVRSQRDDQGNGGGKSMGRTFQIVLQNLDPINKEETLMRFKKQRMSQMMMNV